jgi:hypothetical protein
MYRYVAAFPVAAVARGCYRNNRLQGNEGKRIRLRDGNTAWTLSFARLRAKALLGIPTEDGVESSASMYVEIRSGGTQITSSGQS